MNWLHEIAEFLTGVKRRIEDRGLDVPDVIARAWKGLEGWLDTLQAVDGSGVAVVNEPEPAPDPAPAPDVPPNPAPFKPFRALMATDWGCCKGLSSAYGSHVGTWREAGIDTIYVVGDLRVGDGTRPHIEDGRLPGAPTLCFVENLNLIRTWGFRVIIAGGNEPSVRTGGSEYLGLWEGTRVGPEDCYTDAMLQQEMDYYYELLGGFVPDGIVLYLEPSHPSASGFQARLAKYLRTRCNYTDRLYDNGIGAARMYQGDTDMLSVHTAPSLNWATWQTPASRGQLVNCDGMFELNQQSATTIIPAVTSNPGPDGWVLWFDAYRGIGGPSKLQEWMWRGIR